MKINGHQIREALKLKKLELAALNSSFQDSLYKFEGEQKEAPGFISLKILSVEGGVAALQTLQNRYNQEVMVDLGNIGFLEPLQMAINSIGAFGRMAKLWRALLKEEKGIRRRYSAVPTEKTRKSDEIISKPQFNPAEVLSNAKTYESQAAKLRIVIAKGNMVDIDIQDSDAKLFS